MAKDYRKGPNQVHPELPSALGSRNSLNRDNRDEYLESRLVVDEEVDKVLNHIHGRLPPEVLQDLVVQGNLKSYLHSYYNQSMQNMVNRYMTTAEDEIGKKARDLIDKEEHRALNRYTPREVADLLNQIGGSQVFNTEEVEKSSINIMSHLQGHMQRGVYEFETSTVGLLMQQTDVARFISGSNTYAVVKATFRDNYAKPEEVSDVKLVVNVLDAELISPVIIHQIVNEHLVKNMITEHIISLIDREIDEVNKQLKQQNRESLSQNEMIFEKIKSVENYTEDDVDNENSRRYDVLPKRILDHIKGMGREGLKMEENYDPLSIRSQVDRMLEDGHYRIMGWNTAVNTITSLLDNSRMGYQHVENYKLARRLIIREYEETQSRNLPDERYEIEMRYLGMPQIREEKSAYTAQLLEFQREIMRLWDVVEGVYREEKSRQNRRDWNDLVETKLSRRRAGWFGGDPEKEQSKKWDEVAFVKRDLSHNEAAYRTYEDLTNEFRERLLLLRGRIQDIFQNLFPSHREILEQRLNFLEGEFGRFMSRVNPFHVQPGLLLELAITSVKRRRVTIQGMANVLNNFLSDISRGYTAQGLKPKRYRSVLGSQDRDSFERGT